MIVVTAADGRLLPGTAAGQLTAGGAAAGQPAARQLALNSARRWTELRAWAGNDSVASFGKSRCCGKCLSRSQGRSVQLQALIQRWFDLAAGGEFFC